MALGDFNGDGKLDLATANWGSSTVSLLLGNGKGHFSLATSPATGSAPASVVVGDFNGDGKLDLATANWNSSTASILLRHIPAVTLSPTSLDFGDELVGTKSSPQPVTLTNSGSAPLKIRKSRAVRISLKPITARPRCQLTNSAPLT